MTFPIEVRQQIWERSSGLCERQLESGKRCLAPAVDIHHIVPKALGGRKGVMREAIDDIRNGMAVCRFCHDTVSLWDPAADSLVPGAAFRYALRTGKGLEAFYPVGGEA